MKEKNTGSGSVNKTFELLEFVLNANGMPVTPSEAAQALNFSAPTCVRLLNVLTKRGYVVQKSRKEGYLPGPAVFSFNNSGGFYAHLAKTSESIVRNIALKIERMVLISTYHKGKKFLINRFDGSIHPRPLNNAYNDFYTTVSGRLLLAHQPEKEIENYLAANGLPGPAWDMIDSKDKLLKELSAIRAGEYYCLHTDENLWCVALPIHIPGQPCLSISTSVIKENSIPMTLDLLKNTVGEIKGYFSNEESSVY